MGLGQLIIILLIIAIILGLINKYGPTYLGLDGMILKILNSIVFIAVIFWLITVFGLLDSINSIHVGRK